MESQLLEEISEKDKKRKEKSKKTPQETAQENIQTFLKELDEKASRGVYIDDPFEDEYPKKSDEGDVVRILDDYDTRKNNVIFQWEELKAKVRLEAKNGFMSLTKEKKYAVFVKRRVDAEKILQNTHLGSRDTKELREKEDAGLVATIAKIYETYGLLQLDKIEEEDAEENNYKK